MKTFVGIDLGSTTTKAILLDANREVIGRGITNSRSNYATAASVAVEEARVDGRFTLFRRALAADGRLGSQADAFLLPSATESFGLAALEAMACEVPVVASAVGGLPEVVDHGVSGFLHPADDVAGMADAVTDDMLDVFAVTATWDELAGKVLDRYRGAADRIVMYFSGSGWREDATAFGRWAEVAAAVRSGAA